jgi:iron complex outermembrane receptor protein
VSALCADEVDIDSLLDNIEKKTDLSSKTKLENGGISLVYTRDELNRMQAKNLNDVLKTAYLFGYAENRYGLPDPYNMGTNHPYVSSSIRVFVDNQELTTGLYGSGFILYGDMDIGFVDHIEIYSGNPTYEYSTESTFVLIKLYSKKALKDEGSGVSANVGSYGDSFVSLYSSHELEDEWSYFAYASYSNDIRKKYNSFDTELSKDKTTSHAFVSFADDNNRILFDAIVQDRDTFMDLSMDATPEKADMKCTFLHVGYDGEYDNFSYLISYDMMNIDSNFKDDVTPKPPAYIFPLESLEVNSESYIISAELKHNYVTESNKLITGIKYRYKGFDYEKVEANYVDARRVKNKDQTVGTIFFENQYSIEENSILTTGVSFSSVQNSHSEQDDDLWMYRIGHTYTTQEMIFKTIYSHMELSLDPYMVDAYGTYITPGKKNITRQNIFMEDIIYEKSDNRFETILSYMITHDHLMPDPQSGLLYNYNDDINVLDATFRWTLDYNQFDQLYSTASISYISNVPNVEDIRKYELSIRGLNTYNKFDIFNELIYNKNDKDGENYYDYNAGVIYHYNDDLSISAKGINIFNSSHTTTFYRVDPQTFQKESPLKISPIDQHFMLGMEYLF